MYTNKPENINKRRERYKNTIIDKKKVDDLDGELWKPIKVNYGKSVSWLEWLSSSGGGNMSSKQIRATADLEKHEIKSRIASLYRKFTDQLMTSISELGAP